MFEPAAHSRAGVPEVPVVGVVLALLVLVQVTVLAFVPSPWAAPDVVTIGVLAVGHRRGAMAGGFAGAWAGALLDLVPPAAGPLGAWMLVLGLVGAAHGHMVATRRPGPWLSMLLIGASAASACALHAAVLWFVGIPVGSMPVLRATTASGLWALALAPVALVLTGGVRRRGQRGRSGPPPGRLGLGGERSVPPLPGPTGSAW